MAVTIRLTRCGFKKQPFYRIIATERLTRRDGPFIEILGTYNPRTDPPSVTLKEDRVRRWVGVGAKPTKVVRAIIARHIPNLVEDKEKHQRAKIQAKRKARKQRARARQK